MFLCCSYGAGSPRTADNGMCLALKEVPTEDFDQRSKLEETVPEKPLEERAAAQAERAAAQANITLFHYTVRWAKPWREVEEAANGIDMKTMCCAKHLQNGNAAIHIAAQNGHLRHVQELIASGALVNEKNAKGNTALHMSVEYDYYFTSKFLLAAGADRLESNDAGYLAIHGIEGGKSGHEAWDNPVIILRATSDEDELDIPFEGLEMALKTPELISKENLIKCGLAKKSSPAAKEFWDHKRFMTLAKKF